jgi:tRNA A-37 threonylcarbamoyl transferase component Bud32
VGTQRVYEATYLGRASLIKPRFKKKYRHPVLDVKLTKSRLQMVRQPGFCLAQEA